MLVTGLFVLAPQLVLSSCDQPCASGEISFVRPWEGHGCGVHVKLCPTGSGTQKFQYSSIPDSTATGWHEDANFFFEDTLFAYSDCVDVQFFIRDKDTQIVCKTLTQRLCKGALTDFSVNVTQPTCSQPSGTVAVTLTSIPVSNPGYSAKYDVVLANLPFTSSCTCEITQATPTCTCTFSNLAPGTYTACAVLNRECAFCQDNIVVNQAPTIGIAVSQEDPNCGQYDGSITVNVTGAIGGTSYTYHLDGQTYGPTSDLSHTFDNLSAQVYHVFVQDNNGCESVLENVTLSDQGADFTLSTAVTDALCSGASDGTITVFVYDGHSVYSYSFDNGATWQDSNVKTNLPAGNYHIIVEDKYTSCRVATTADIIQPDPLSATIDTLPPACNGGLGHIHMVVFGGTEPYTVTITPVNDPSHPVIIYVDPSHQVDYHALPGLYDITVNDSNGCTYTLNYPVEIPEQPEIIITATPHAPACYGQEGSITISATGGAPTYLFYVDGVEVAANVNENTPVTVPASLGTHEVQVKDTHQCVVTDAYVTVTDTSEIAIDVTYITAPSCYGQEGSVNVVVHGGTPPYTISFDGQEMTDVADGQEVTFFGLPGTHTIVVTDYNGCVQETYVEIPEAVELSFKLVRVCGGVNITITGGSQPYQIFVDSILFASNVLAGEKTFIELATGSYEISVIDAHECTVSQRFIEGLGCEVTVTRATPPPPSVLASPKNVCAYQECHRFPLRSDLINIITWRAGDQKAVSFAIYDASDLNNVLEIVPASATLVFRQHNRSCGKKTTYNIYAIDASGNYSVPAVITVP